MRGRSTFTPICLVQAGRPGPRNSLRPPDDRRYGALALRPTARRSRLGQSQGSRSPRCQTVGPGRYRHAVGLRSGPLALRERTGQPPWSLRLVFPPAPRRLSGASPHAVPLLRDPFPSRELFRRSGHRCLHRQGGCGGGNGGGRVRRTLCGGRLPTGGDRLDGRPVALRTSGGRGRTGRGRRAASGRLGAGRRPLYSGLYVDLAHPLAR